MINLPEHIKLKFFETIFGNVNIKDFENWIYNDKEIETILGDSLDLISFNYKKNGAKYELVKLLADKYIDLGEYEKWKMLNLLIKAREKDESLPYILNLYCKGTQGLDHGGRHI